MTTKTTTSNEMILTRFDISQRIQHILLILSFSMLGLTGLPQSFAQTGWARAWMGLFGGIAGVRKVHHFFAVLMAFLFFYHVIVVIGDMFKKRFPRLMLPKWQDFKDALQAVRYLLGKAEEPPEYDRFDFRQKLEYWALIWGTILMGGTGLVLMFPVAVTNVLPGEVVYAAKAAHSLEALLAVASIISWHMYNAHFAQGIFPIDMTIFTGKISEERMQEEHPLEYERMMNPADEEGDSPVKRSKKGNKKKKTLRKAQDPDKKGR